jgi:hypothetical protein
MWWRRRRPAICASTTWPLSSSTEKVVLGKTCLILPNTSSGASFVFWEALVLEGRGLDLRFRVRVAIVDTPVIYGNCFRRTLRHAEGPRRFGAWASAVVLTTSR